MLAMQNVQLGVRCRGCPLHAALNRRAAACALSCAAPSHALRPVAGARERGRAARAVRAPARANRGPQRAVEAARKGGATSLALAPLGSRSLGAASRQRCAWLPRHLPHVSRLHPRFPLLTGAPPGSGRARVRRALASPSPSRRRRPSGRWSSRPRSTCVCGCLLRRARPRAPCAAVVARLSLRRAACRRARCPSAAERCFLRP